MLKSKVTVTVTVTVTILPSGCVTMLPMVRDRLTVWAMLVQPIVCCTRSCTAPVRWSPDTRWQAFFLKFQRKSKIKPHKHENGADSVTGRRIDSEPQCSRGYGKGQRSHQTLMAQYQGRSRIHTSTQKQRKSRHGKRPSFCKDRTKLIPTQY